MSPRSSPAFTLIELLVVIAVIAILSVVVLLTLNPAELLRQARDSNRVSDLASMTEALQAYTTDQSSGNLGSSSVVYVSLPDNTATSTAGDQCQGLGLPSLPASYSYHCAASSTVKNVNGSGWIPVNLLSSSFGSPLGSLAIDPINTSSSRSYFTYTTNGTQFELTSPMESAKYKLGGSGDVISGDGGTLATIYEKGTKLGLEPLDYGDSSLVGLWTFDEGTSTIAYDYSGNNATGSWSGTQTGTSGYYSAGKIGSYAGTFDGSTTEVGSMSAPANLNGIMSVAAWVTLTTYSVGHACIVDASGGHSLLGSSNTSARSFETAQGGTIPLNTWHFLVGTFDGTTSLIYIDGILATSSAGAVQPGQPFKIGNAGPSSHWTGLIDDVRIYNRALSAGEIAAMYNGGK